jgi:hypothetical protein
LVGKFISSAEITRSVQAIAVPSVFPKERGGEKTCSDRCGTRNVVWYVFQETGKFRVYGLVLHHRYMFIKPFPNAAPKIAIKRKSTPV